jgi:myo-inositol-1(or 4)-monophosphatase
MMEDLDQIQEVAVFAAREAGKYILKNVGKIKEVTHKEGLNNLVTDVDKASEKIIIGIIKDSFPGHSILAEESGREDAASRITWVIDPIDGTINYEHGFPVFCVSIGVAFGDVIKIGAVYDPTRDELFYAQEGKGAFLNGRKINVSSRDKIQDSLVATGFPYNLEGRIRNFDNFKTMLGSARAVRRPGSAAIDLSYIACGRLDGYWELGLSPWDTAAAQLLVKEAGGSVTTFYGGTYGIFEKEIVATNGKIHDEMLSLLQ